MIFKPLKKKKKFGLNQTSTPSQSPTVKKGNNFKDYINVSARKPQTKLLWLILMFYHSYRLKFNQIYFIFAILNISTLFRQNEKIIWRIEIIKDLNQFARI